MTVIVTKEEAKAQLNITIADDDPLIDRLISAAQSHVEKWLGYAIDDEWPPTEGDAPQPTAPDDLRQAVLMIVGHWYENREASLVGVVAQSLPMGVADILASYRTYTFGLSDA